MQLNDHSWKCQFLEIVVMENMSGTSQYCAKVNKGHNIEVNDIVDSLLSFIISPHGVNCINVW